jgi:hypothetical protein
MDKEAIFSLEGSNDGRSVFLFYDVEEGYYKAFGRSAYYADMVTNGRLYYSEDLLMPVTVLSKRAVMDLRLNMTIVEHRTHDYYQLKMKTKIGDVGYERWMETLIARLSKNLNNKRIPI